MNTIGQTISHLQDELRDYIEATYHISHPFLVRERQRLLSEAGNIYQVPYIESTPKYVTGDMFRSLGLHEAALEAFAAVSGIDGGSCLIHDPPYQHQAEAIKDTLACGRDTVVMTGTGSGKTECFLLPILGKLAMEAAEKRSQFAEFNAVRCIILYPMNALVNDQLGRLRLLFGDPRITTLFNKWCGRPIRFARYTSRTLYPGIRTRQKDQQRLAPIGRYYVDHLRKARDPDDPQRGASARLIAELKRRGKWPAKPDLERWYGRPNQRWTDRNGRFARCVTLPEDVELLTRHEVLEAPPDILLTNYSMLEYMLMRPIERPIFDRTSAWLRENPNERFLIVIDEAHLYRGAAGAEVALLLRRLRSRLAVPEDRIQVICTSASFADHDYAAQFAARLSGKTSSGFTSITGTLDLRNNARPGSAAEAELLGNIDLQSFYNASDDQRSNVIQSFLTMRGVSPDLPLHLALYEALREFEPLNQLINLSMQSAIRLDSLGGLIFPEVDPEVRDKAVTTLLAFGSIARREPDLPGLLPCRIHCLFRGLAGLWACLDPQCTAISETDRGGPTGRPYSQPRDICSCGARVYELFTCRNCGTAYARAYTDDVESPRYLWSEKGNRIRTEQGDLRELSPIDLLLEAPAETLDNQPEPLDFDVVTGQGSPNQLGERVRQVFLQPNRVADGRNQISNSEPGQFSPCAVCDEQAGYGRSSVQDHQTSGDQPFQALVSKQIAVQPPGPHLATPFAPLRGRKSLVFSDSRQTAARLAPNLKSLSMKDALRPLLLAGFARMYRFDDMSEVLTLDHSYFAVLLAAHEYGVRLRPEIRQSDDLGHETQLTDRLNAGLLNNPREFGRFVDRFLRTARPPVSLLNGIYDIIFARYYGLEALGLASICERLDLSQDLIIELPDLPGLAESEEQKLALLRNWIRYWQKPERIWLSLCPDDWRENTTDRSNRYISTHNTGKFGRFERNFLTTSTLKRSFRERWLPALLSHFCTQTGGGGYRLSGGSVTLLMEGPLGLLPDMPHYPTSIPWTPHLCTLWSRCSRHY